MELFFFLSLLELSFMTDFFFFPGRIGFIWVYKLICIEPIKAFSCDSLISLCLLLSICILLFCVCLRMHSSPFPLDYFSQFSCFVFSLERVCRAEPEWNSTAGWDSSCPLLFPSFSPSTWVTSVLWPEASSTLSCFFPEKPLHCQSLSLHPALGRPKRGPNASSCRWRMDWKGWECRWRAPAWLQWPRR